MRVGRPKLGEGVVMTGMRARALAAWLAAVSVVVGAASAVASTEGAIRLGGSDRYETSVLVSRATFEPGVDLVYLASGENFPDALAGGAVAGQQEAPVLLTKPSALPGVVEDELARLDPERVVILGGEGAVSAAVATAAASFTAGTVDRIAGANRYETAADVAISAFPSGADVVFVSSGENFPDALSGAAAAAKVGGPILLTRAGHLPSETDSVLAQLDPERIIVLGGENAIAESVIDSLESSSRLVERISGADRFETAARVAEKLIVSSEVVYVANGLAFPDALSGAPVASQEGAPILLVKPDSVSDEACLEMGMLLPRKIVALGGTAAVSDSLLGHIEENCSRYALVARTDPSWATSVDSPAISGDGRYVAFTLNHNTDDGSANSDLVVWDRETRTSESLDGANAATPAINADGRYIAFTSEASNLVPGDTNGVADAFLWDLATRTVTRVTEGVGGSQPDDYSSSPSISSDGRYVAFSSRASNLVADDPHDYDDVFLWDRITREETLVSLEHTPAVNAAISADGAHVAYSTAPGVYAWNGDDGTTTLVDAQGETSRNLVSADGRYVAYGRDFQIYLWDRATSTHTLVVGQRSSITEGAISSDGRYLVFFSFGQLLPGDSNPNGGLFVWDRDTGDIARVDVGANWQSNFPDISDDGRYITFRSVADNLVPGNAHGIFLTRNPLSP